MRNLGLAVPLTVLALPILLVVGCDRFPDGSGWSGCPEVEYPDHHPELVTIEQGLWGDVWFWEGDFMPPCPSGSVCAVSREMRIHELAGLVV